MIPFKASHLTGKELGYIAQSLATGKTSGNGPFTQKCQTFFEDRYGFARCLLTTSGTDALEMAAMLADIRPGDEVIMPSYTFVSTALAFVRQGATIVFADSRADHPNLDADRIEPLITPRTRAIVPVHYAGVACDMGRIMELAEARGLLVIADAAHAIDSYYTGPLPAGRFAWHDRIRKRGGGYPLGGIGHFGCFSFHESKNIQCGEGGMLTVNDPQFIRRAEVVWEKGTNRAEFFRGEVSKYQWVDVGSSFLPSGITAAFLWAQLEALSAIREKHLRLWESYYAGLQPLAQQGFFCIPQVPAYAVHNAHLFYVVCRSEEERRRLMAFLLEKGIQTATHYQSLHDSPYYRDKYKGPELVNCKHFVNCLVRLPLFYDLALEQVREVVTQLEAFYAKHGEQAP